MVEMGVREQEVAVDLAVLAQLDAEGPEAGAGIQDHEMRAAANLDASSVSAVADVFAARTGNGAAHAVEVDHDIVG
jgi:hypothetical protein